MNRERRGERESESAGSAGAPSSYETNESMRDGDVIEKMMDIIWIMAQTLICLIRFNAKRLETKFCILIIYVYVYGKCKKYSCRRDLFLKILFVKNKH